MNRPFNLVPFLCLALLGIGTLFATAQEDGPHRMAAVFVNEHPREEITLYWVDPQVPDGHPERLVRVIIYVFYEK